MNGYRGRARVGLAALGIASLFSAVAGCVSTPRDPTPSPTAESLLASLPRIPWEGGPAHYEQFPDAAAHGWTDPEFFPISLWWGAFASGEEVAWDRAHGINTYIVTNPDADPELLLQHDMSWIGGPLHGMTRDHPAWVGDFLDDEVDGRYTPAAGAAHLTALSEALPDHDKLRYANHTGMVLSTLPTADSERYVNAWTDAVSVDKYWYTIAECDHDPFTGSFYLVPIPEETCRTASSYGRTVAALRQRDAADGRLQAVWNFVEVVSAAPEGRLYPISPEQVKGAAMNSVIHEARGLVWFNNAFLGDCATGNVIRTAQKHPDWPCAPQVAAMGELNATIHRHARVLNTQSLDWQFGDGLDTMLKVHDGHAWVFAMTDGGAGERTFKLPPGLRSDTVEVVDEGRTLPVTWGRFTDTFATEATFHIYRIPG